MNDQKKEQGQAQKASVPIQTAPASSAQKAPASAPTSQPAPVQKTPSPPATQSVQQLQVVTPPTQDSPVKEKKGKKSPAVLYLGRFQFEYIAQDMNQSIKMQFPQELVRDLEVVNQIALKDAVKAFITQHRLEQSEITLILADEIIFTKALTVPDPKAIPEEIQRFVDSVPFEETAYVRIPASPSAFTVAVANKEYFEVFKRAFEESGFTVVRVLPALIMAKDINLAKTADVQSLQTAIKKSMEYQQYAFICEAPLIQESQAQTSFMTFTADNKKTDRKRMFVMVGFLIFLLGVLGVVFTTMYQPVPKVPAVTNVPAPASAVPIATPTPTIVSSSSGQLIQTTRTIRIQYAQQGAATATALSSRLRELGVTSIEVVPVPAGASQTLRTVFSTAISPEEKQLLTKEIQIFVPQMSFIENAAPAVDVLITVLN